MARIAFFSNQLGMRGTEIAMYDYADLNERLLGNQSFIMVNGETDPARNDGAARFQTRFGQCFAPKNRDAVEALVRELRIDVLYRICAGQPETLPRNCRTAVHVVFAHYEPFGDVYAYVSEWLRNATVPRERRPQHDFVPHVVRLPDDEATLRDELRIASGDVVFGYHGGADSFNIPFVKDAVRDALEARADLQFVFMNIPPWIEHPRVRFLPGCYDLVRKTRFINTCDAMLHARDRGETFGLAVAEFSIRHKPVVTFRNSPERCHLEILGPKALTYGNRVELARILTKFRRPPNLGWDCYSSRFGPEPVMKRFREVFLN